MGNEDPVLVPHLRSTVSFLSTQDCVARVELLLGDEAALEGEQVVPYLAVIRDLVKEPTPGPR